MTDMKPDDVRIVRDHYELTQAEMGALVGVDGRSWRRWEAGERQIPLPVQRLLRLIMAVPEAYRALQRIAKRG